MLFASAVTGTEDGMQGMWLQKQNQQARVDEVNMAPALEAWLQDEAAALTSLAHVY